MPVVRAHDHRNPRPRLAGRKRNFSESRANGPERGLGAPVTVREAELPVFDVVAPAVPFVGPCEHKGSGAAGSKGRPDLPIQRGGLSLFGMPVAVQPDLGHEERTLPGDVLQPGEVSLQLRLRLEIDVEANQVDERQLQVFGRGVIDVRHEAGGVLVLCGPVQPLDPTLYTASSVPANDRGRDLIANRVAKDGRMTGARAHSGAYPLLN